MLTVAALLQVEDLTRQFASPGHPPVTVLDGVTFALGRGESLAVVGPSGSGKSTLLNLIGTLDRPTRGRVLLGGQEVTRLGATELAALRNRQIGLVFQAHHLLPQCTVIENVLVPTLASTNEVLRDGAPDRARRLLERVGLGARLRHRPGQLSGGECQRVAVVRALINEPELLLADEPTGALDHQSAEQLGDLLVELNREVGVTLIVVTHSLPLARRLGRTLELRDGRLQSP